MKYFSVLILLSLASCNDSALDLDASNSSQDQMNDTFHLPLDTAEILKNFGFELQGDVMEIPADEFLDTFELTHVSYACDCQDWVLTKEYEIWKTDPFLFQKADDKSAFNTDDYGFFLKAADKTVKIPDDFYSFSNRIRII